MKKIFSKLYGAIRKTVPYIAGVFAVLCLAGILLRATGLRDKFLILSTVYYALPPVLMAVICGGLFLYWRKRCEMTAFLCLVMAVVCAGIWTFGGFCWNEPESVERTPDSIRVFSWNAYWGNLGWENIVEQLRESDADIIGMVQSDSNPYDNDRYWKEQFPDYNYKAFVGAVMIMVRGRIISAARGELGSGGRYIKAVVSVKGREISLVLVHFKSNPFILRKTEFDTLKGVITEMGAERPIIVMGDFNTPYGSRRFDSFREKYIEAFVAAGRGQIATWPEPLPVLSLDHIWCDKRFTVLSCRNVRTWSSDHFAVMADLEW